MPDARDQPLVTVVIPTRDRHHTLALAVRSVADQTYRPLELVVVDDASSPPVELDVHTDPGLSVKLLRTDRHEGSATARNLAVDASSGELIAFLDDDDAWRPDKLTRQVELLLAADGSVAGVDCGYDHWDGRRLREERLPDPDRDLPRALLENPTICPSTLLLRRSAFLDAGRFHEGRERTEDWDLWVRLADRWRIAPLQEVLVDRRVNEPSPDVVLDCYRAMVRSLEPRIGRLESRERTRVGALHEFNQGVLLARAGATADARRTLLRAWRRNPRRLAPLVQLGRTVLGDARWERLVRPLDPLRVRVGSTTRVRGPRRAHR
jgi:glycosyltransferase involved in cell wall biosynthesis